MRHRLRYGSVVALGLGAGTVLGFALGRPAMIVAFLAFVVGLALATFGWSSTASEVVPDPAAPAAKPVAAPTKRPTIAGLGSRVEQILGLAEKQALDHLTRAQREADEIVAAARAQAGEILDRAQAQAAGSAPEAGTDPAQRLTGS